MQDRPESPIDPAPRVLRVGDRVIKDSGDYVFEGEVRSVFTKRSGVARIAVEDDRGLLLILNEKQVEALHAVAEPQAKRSEPA